MRDELMLETPEQVSALAHPLRLRALSLLNKAAYTNSQLAELLGVPRARLHFHVRELARAGLIEIVEERPKVGVIEKYYRATARYIWLAPDLIASSPELQNMAIVTWEAAHQTLMHAIRHFGSNPPGLRSAFHDGRLSPAAYARVQEHIRAIDEEYRVAKSEPDREDDVQASFAYLTHYTTPDARGNGDGAH
jgi:DNA-binding transcriptional ArsR family regulator